MIRFEQSCTIFGMRSLDPVLDGLNINWTKALELVEYNCYEHIFPIFGMRILYLILVGLKISNYMN